MNRLAILVWLLVAAVIGDGNATAPPPARPGLVAELWAHKNLLHAIHFRPDGKQVLGACTKGLVVVWDLPSQKVRYSIPCDAVKRPVIAYSADSRRLAICTSDGAKEGGPGALALYDAETGKRLWEANLPPSSNGISFSPDGRLIACKAKGVRLFRAADGKPAGVIRCNAASIGPPLWSLDGNRIALPARITLHPDVEILDVVELKRLKPLARFPRSLLWARFGKSNAELTTIHEDGTLRNWDLTQAQEIPSDKKLSLPRSSKLHSNATAVSPDATLVAVCDLDGVVRLCDTGSGKQVWSVKPRYDGAEEQGGQVVLSFSPDGRWLATAVNDWAFEIWDVKKIANKR